MSNKVLIFIALWAVLTLLEAVLPANRMQRVFSHHTLTDALCLFVNKVLLRPALTAIRSLFIFHVLEPHAPQYLLSETVRGLPIACQFLVAVFLIDLAQYLRHRMTHALLWSCHATHHSAVEMRASVHWRLHPADLVVMGIVDTAVLFVLGFPGGVIVLSQLFMTMHNMWLHANLDVDYGPLRRVFVSPNYHKWHHAKEERAIDKNFADLFVIFDILGGTHYYPHTRRPESYGVHGEPDRAALHQHYPGAMLYPFTQLRDWLSERALSIKIKRSKE